LRVLIVEDEFLIRLHVEELVNGAGHKVAAAAATGREALAAAERVQPDMALMDIGLAGDMDGVATARELFRRWRIRSLFVSANCDQFRDSAADVRPLGFLTKPVSPQRLIQALEAAAAELRRS
jgi:CheY-like chemotaxis protein